VTLHEGEAAGIVRRYMAEKVMRRSVGLAGGGLSFCAGYK